MDASGNHIMRLVTAAAFTAGLALVSPASGVMIDDFSDTDDGTPTVLMVRDPVVNATSAQDGLSGVVGGSRFMELQAVSFDVNGLDFAQATVAPGPGVLDYTSTVGTQAYVRVLYQGASGGFDLDLSGDQFVQINLTNYDAPGGATMDVTVSIGVATHGAVLTKTVSGPGSHMLIFPIADFVPIGTIDLAHVANIGVRFEPPTSGDFRVGEIFTAVPEPATLGLIGLGGLPLLLRRRRRDAATSNN